MATAAALTVVLRAQTEAFDRAMKDSGGRIKEFAAAQKEVAVASKQMESAFAKGVPENASALMANVKSKQEYLDLTKRLSAEEKTAHSAWMIDQSQEKAIRMNNAIDMRAIQVQANEVNKTGISTINEMGDSLEKTSEKQGIFGKKLAQGLTRFVSLIYLMRAATAAMNAYSDAVDAGKSGMDTFLDVLKSLPMVGELSTAGIRLIVPGAVKEMEALAKANTVYYDVKKKNIDLVKEMRRQIELTGVSEAEKARLKALYEEEDLLKKIKDLSKSLRDVGEIKAAAAIEKQMLPMVAELARKKETADLNAAINEKKELWEKEANDLRVDRIASEEAMIEVTKAGIEKDLALLRLRHRVEFDEYLRAGRDKTYLIKRQSYEETAIKQKYQKESELAAAKIKADEAQKDADLKARAEKEIETLKTKVELFKDYRAELELMNKAYPELITNERMLELLKKKTGELMGDKAEKIRGPGTFRQIDTTLMDIRGLGSMGVVDPGATRDIERNRLLNEQLNLARRQLEKDGVPV